MSNCLQSTCHTFDMNWKLKLSVTVSSGNPYTRNTWWNSAVAVSMAVGRPFSWTKWQAFEKRSVIIRIVVKLLELGRSLAKSTDRWDQGLWGMGSSSRSLVGSSLGVFNWAHTGQDLTYEVTSLFMSAHQNELCIKVIVHWIPGCPALRDLWTHWITRFRRLFGTYCLAGGHLGGGVSVCCANWMSMMSQRMGATTTYGGRMETWLFWMYVGSYLLERVSTLLFLLPGW